MFSQCANPECRKSFNYRQGRLFRFSNILPGHRLVDHACIKHFWLCDDCNRDYVLEHEINVGIVLRSRPSVSAVRQETTVSVFCRPIGTEDSAVSRNRNVPAHVGSKVA